MNYDRLTKDELEKILRDKKLALKAAESLPENAAEYVLPQDVIRSLMSGGCRLCVWDTKQVRQPYFDPDTQEEKVKMVEAAIGQPYAESRGMARGNEPQLPCRTCVHVRRALEAAGVSDVYV